jgi:signal peptidase I
MYCKIDHYKKKVNKQKIFKDIILIYIFAVIFVLLINSVVIQAYKIHSNSMEPQIKENQRILVNKFITGPKYPFTDIRVFNNQSNIQRGDVIVFLSDEYIKKNIFFRIVSNIIYTISFSLIELPDFKKSSLDDHNSHIFIKRVIGVPGDIID